MTILIIYWLTMCQVLFYSPPVYEKRTIIMPISQMWKWCPSKIKANLHLKLTLALKYATIDINLQVHRPSWFFSPTRLKLLKDLHHTYFHFFSLPSALSMKQIEQILAQETSMPYQ